MDWSDEGRPKSLNGCPTPVLTCSPQSNATSLKTPNLSSKQGSYPHNNNNNNNNSNNNNNGSYPSQYETSLLMSSHPAYNEAPPLPQQQHNHPRKQQFATPTSPLSPALLSPFSPPSFSSGGLHHNDHNFPSTPPSYQSPEKRNCPPMTNGVKQQQRQQPPNASVAEDTKKSVSENNNVATVASTTTTITPTASTKTTPAVPTANSVEAKLCAACDRSISDRYLLFTADRYWHLDCLRCSSCNVALAEVGSTCFSRSGMTLCRSDYIRMFGSTGVCTSCRQTIPANDYVMKTSQGSVYHVTCFCCVTCSRTLVPGDKYGLLHGNLLCENDYWVAMTAGQNNLVGYGDAHQPPPISQQQQQQQQPQQQQQQHPHLPPPPPSSSHHHHHHHHHQQQFRGCSQPMMNGKGMSEDHRHHHHHQQQHHHHQQQQQQQTPQHHQQQNQHQQHLNQMRFSHKVG